MHAKGTELVAVREEPCIGIHATGVDACIDTDHPCADALGIKDLVPGCIATTPVPRPDDRCHFGRWLGTRRSAGKPALHAETQPSWPEGVLTYWSPCAACR